MVGVTEGRILSILIPFIIVCAGAQGFGYNATMGRAFNFNPFTAFNSNLNGGNNLNGWNNFYNIFGNQNAFQQSQYSDCTTKVGTLGVCMRPLECSKSSGVASGFCSITTVCCSVLLQCTGSSSAKRVVMENNALTTTVSNTLATCSYTINRFSQYVCQLRVDFNTNMPQPSATTVPLTNAPSCTGTYLQINNMRFCGVNNNQHVYVPFSLPAATQQVSVVIGNSATGTTNPASWRIVVTQLECPPSANLGTALASTTLAPGTGTFNSGTSTLNPNLYTTQYPGQIFDIKKLLHKRNFDTDLIAPNGCLQYFPAPSGVFESFNFNGGTGPYPPNMQYAICFYRPTTSSGIQFSASSFSMSFNNGNLNPMLDDDCFDKDGLTPTATNDYLLIPFSTIVGGTTTGTAERYCGMILENVNLVANPPGPYMAIVNTGSVFGPLDPGLDPRRAFQITYNVF